MPGFSDTVIVCRVNPMRDVPQAILAAPHTQNKPDSAVPISGEDLTACSSHAYSTVNSYGIELTGLWHAP